MTSPVAHAGVGSSAAATAAASAAAEKVWASLTDVERTCLGVAFYRWHGSRTCCWPDGNPWYADPCGRHTVLHCIPAAEQARLLEWTRQEKRPIFQFVAVRTAELDHQISAALAVAATNEHHPIQQMVILGAGADTRAWRLPWPPGFRVFEVDSEAVLGFKDWMMGLASSSHGSGSGSGSGSALLQPDRNQYDDHDVMPGLSCEARVAVAADASKPEELWERLLVAGLKSQVATLWLLEGFIGYITREDAAALVHDLYHKSARGSRIIITAPPTPAEEQRSAAGGQLAAAAGAPAVTAAAAAAGSAAPDPDKSSAEGSANHSPAAPAAVAPALESKLHHSTFEEPEETLARLSAAGWQDSQLLTAEQLAHKYATATAQPILLGCKH